MSAAETMKLEITSEVANAHPLTIFGSHIRLPSCLVISNVRGRTICLNCVAIQRSVVAPHPTEKRIFARSRSSGSGHALLLQLGKLQHGSGRFSGLLDEFGGCARSLEINILA